MQTAMIHVGKDSIKINDRYFLLGDVATDLLNMNEEFSAIYQRIEEINKFAKSHSQAPPKEEWFQVNETFLEIHNRLLKYKVFTAILQDDFNMFAEIKKYTTSKFDVPSSVSSFLEIFKNSDKDLPPESCDYIVSHGTADERWTAYKKWIFRYYLDINDVLAFNFTITNFIRHFISKEKRIDEYTYAGAYYDFINYKGAERYIMDFTNPYGNGVSDYRTVDFYDISFLPIKNQNGDYEMVDVIRVTDLQSILKLDFVRAIRAGHIIRRCKHCNRYFLLTKCYATAYCDGNSPENPKFTCQQMGRKRQKELSANFPYAREKKRATDLVKKHLERGIITGDDCDKIVCMIEDLYYMAVRNGVAYDDFKNQMQVDALYKNNGVIKKLKQRGRPKKEI